MLHSMKHRPDGSFYTNNEAGVALAIFICRPLWLMHKSCDRDLCIRTGLLPPLMVVLQTVLKYASICLPPHC